VLRGYYTNTVDIYSSCHIVVHFSGFHPAMEKKNLGTPPNENDHVLSIYHDAKESSSKKYLHYHMTLLYEVYNVSDSLESKKRGLAMGRKASNNIDAYFFF
jgi:hypothetical protein